MNKNIKRWINECINLTDGREATCPNCGGHQFKDRYIELDKKDHRGWGAIWCEDCRTAFVMSRVILTDEAIRQKIVPTLPDDLKFI